MAATVTGHDQDGGYTRQNFSVITNARVSSSEEMAGRMRRYAITMGFRTACFIAMVFVPGAWRWVLFACAVFLPYVAVLFANQAHQREVTDVVEQPSAGVDAPQLTVGPEDVISGDVVDDEPDPPRSDARRPDSPFNTPGGSHAAPPPDARG